jgi:monoterpene epsilon-lactone hydrolase
MRMTRLALRLVGKERDDPEAHRRKLLSRTPPQDAAIPGRFRSKYHIAERQVLGSRAVTLTPKHDPSSWHIVYTHGGGYVNPLVLPHWWIIDRLVQATGATVTVPFYPLAPESDHRAAFSFLKAVYRHVLETTPAKSIALAGDSAGGGLALGQALEYRDAGLPLPGRIVLFAPWLDISVANPAAPGVERFDPMLRVDLGRVWGELWAQGEDPRTPRLSPLYADLHGLPPIDLFQGTCDTVWVDVPSFVQKLRAVGGQVRYFEYAGAFHVFVAATWTPEARDAFRRVGEALPRAEVSIS